ncbi:MAG: type II toxin-antitoxin system RelE/ParE family toxin [Acidobacteria bacterium]|nr:type II toxin-antitoxin system RelE/ParE family toxin [Acidobacteriota bacterium]
MRLQILDSARDDLIDGSYFYEKQEPGLGNYFLASLNSDMEALKLLFGIHPKAYRSFHRALSNRFPFAIYYTHDTEAVLIRAVVDCRRKPSWIRRHIKNA